MNGCKDCAERRKMARDALYRAAVGEAVSHVIKGAAEIIGVKEKTGVAESKRATQKTSGAAGKQPEVGNSEQEQSQ